MVNNAINPNTATELIEIFKFVEEPVLEKIPEKLKQELERISNKEHNFKIDKTKKLQDQAMLQETKELLSAIFIKYCCRKEDGEEILVACRENERKLEEQKRTKYNPDDIFKNRKKNVSEETIVKKKDEIGNFQLVVFKKLPWYKKVARGIGRFFRKKKY